MIENNKVDIALEYFNKAHKYQTEGRISEAADNYRLSIKLFPTAEAHTSLASIYGGLGKYEEAIEECYAAIDLDKDYGNPYNDIGNYLIQLERFEEALLWFEKAINSPRYSERYNPYFNIGHIYEKKGAWFRALEYYMDALVINSEFEPARKAVIKITTLLN
ncbi:MAG: tetratricopeptide repeat protein [Methanococcaceae archaeon]